MVDITQPGDYPILLGDSLKDDASPSSSYISLRYNWIPKSGLANKTGKISATSSGLSLEYDRNGEKLKYTGWLADRPDTDQSPQLALFYDPARSAFVVEKVSAAFNFNLHSGTNITPDHTNRHSQIARQGGSSADADTDALDEDADDEDADDSNPFDYRHFLAEARDNAEKAGNSDNRTPLQGGRTPISGLSSPMGGTHPFQSTTPQFGPTEIIDATHIEDGPEWGGHRRRAKVASKAKATRKVNTSTVRAKAKTSPATKAGQSQQKPLSTERVHESSDSDSDSSTAQPARVTSTTKSKQSKKTTPNKKAKPPGRSPPRSPAIVVNNDSDSGGLEIDSGSPPPASRKSGYKIDAEAFRSMSGTPALQRPMSSQSNTNAAGNANADTDEDEDGVEDIEMPDAPYLVDDDDDGDAVDADESARFLQPATDSDSDTPTTAKPDKRRKPRANRPNADIAELILDTGSPQHSPEPQPAPAPTPKQSPPRSIPVQAPVAQRAKRRTDSTISRTSRTSRSVRAPAPDAHAHAHAHAHRSPSPPAPVPAADEETDEDTRLAEELELALERDFSDDDEHEAAVGLGIRAQGVGVGEHMHVDDEESDVSEEE